MRLQGSLVALLFAALTLAPAALAQAETPSPEADTPISATVDPSASPAASDSASPEVSASPTEVEEDEGFVDVVEVAPDDTRNLWALGIAGAVALVAGVVVFLVKK
jgi:hypothetical protein